MELEQTSKGRLETQMCRLKEVIEGLNKDNENLRVREKATNDELKKMSKVMRETKEELARMRQQVAKLELRAPAGTPRRPTP